MGTGAKKGVFPNRETLLFKYAKYILPFDIP